MEGAERLDYRGVEGTDNVAFDFSDMRNFSDMRMTRAATLDEAELDQLTDLFSDFPLAGEEQPPISLEPLPSNHSTDNRKDNKNVNGTPNTEAVENNRPQRVSVTSNTASSAAKKRRLMINLIVQSFGFLLLFTAYQSLQNLQSSINDDRNIGQTSLAVLYGVLIPSCPFLAPVVMGLLGLKWTITGSMALYVVFTIANYWLEFYTLIPASVLVGAAAACLWAANGAYLTELAIKYAQVSKENLSVVITRFFGIFFGIFQTSQIWGNLISSLVLRQRAESPGPVPEANLTHCGASHCPDAGDVSFTLPQGHSLRVTLISIYLACGVLAVLIMALFADRMKESELQHHCLSICRRKPPPDTAPEDPVAQQAVAEQQEDAPATDWRLLCDRFIVAWRFLFEEKRMMLLIPLITYGTMQQALNVAVFTRVGTSSSSPFSRTVPCSRLSTWPSSQGVGRILAFVGCTLGVHWIGYVMICYGVCDAFSAFLIGRIRNWVPSFGQNDLFHSVTHSVNHSSIPSFPTRQALVAVGAVLNLGLMIHLLALTPHPKYAAVYFVHVGLWGVADAIWQTQINSLYGVLFPGCQEVAFSMDGFWGAIGYTVAFGYGGYLCAAVKIYILLTLLCVSMTTYTVLEVMEWRKALQESAEAR
ncbi:protein unc-93 homolog A-like [Branchiostoma floridae]|uniref:Protein unc-93 homolog A n=1 Tax=Branchiostoma floridae TaxID=7739 RepID=A0A9J7LMR4_BRAFL|nr:protein unc-93 homolog A-like [Branchiostoma floridae]